MRIVIDTNIFISRLLLPNSVPASAAERAIEAGTLLVSEDTLYELAVLLARPKLNGYVSVETRRQLFLEIEDIAKFIPIIQRIRACRDPEDDKFLELAINGRASLILTGDRDLLALHPFRGITIQSPADYLALPRL
jgi:putative PIN family toxin of toxin-antitoxin system